MHVGYVDGVSSYGHVLEHFLRRYRGDVYGPSIGGLMVLVCVCHCACG